MNGNKKKSTSVVNDEVEELLKAAEDEALLKLSLNSHTVHSSPCDLHPDLDQRFRALKAGPKATAKPEASNKRMPPPQTSIAKEEPKDEGDLFARFTALKASLPTASVVDKLAGGSLVGEDNVDDEEEDEVEKVIKWAMDAARLDPSPPSDDDDDDNNKDDDEFDESEMSDEDDDTRGRKQTDRK